MSTHFATGVAAGETKFLWNEKTLNAAPDSENVNTKVRVGRAGTCRALLILSEAPGDGENVTVTPVINGVDSAGTLVVSGEAKGVHLAIPETFAAGDKLSYRVAVSGGSVDVGNIQVSTVKSPA
jgi:hypothetical protein